MSVSATGLLASSKSTAPISRSELRSDAACFVLGEHGTGEPGVDGLPLCLDGDTGGVQIADSAVDEAAGTCTPPVMSFARWMVDIGSSLVGSRCASKVDVLLVTSVIVIGSRFGLCGAGRDLSGLFSLFSLFSLSQSNKNLLRSFNDEMISLSYFTHLHMLQHESNWYAVSMMMSHIDFCCSILSRSVSAGKSSCSQPLL